MRSKCIVLQANDGKKLLIELYLGPTKSSNSQIHARAREMIMFGNAKTNHELKLTPVSEP
jgi:hypothetical protein